jgi:hypothetical protein
MPTGRYTVRVQAEGYEEEVLLLNAVSGVNNLTVQVDPASGNKIVCVPLEGEGGPEGAGEGGTEGAPEGEGEGRVVPEIHTGDPNGDGDIDLSELLDVIALLNVGEYSCGNGGAAYQQGPGGGRLCLPHGADFEGGAADWEISLSELLRLIQFYNLGGYHRCAGTEDGYCPGA